MKTFLRINSAASLADTPEELRDSAKAALVAGYNVELRNINYTNCLFVWTNEESQANAKHFFPLSNWNNALDLVRRADVKYEIALGRVSMQHGNARLIESFSPDASSQCLINRSCALAVAILAGAWKAV